MIIGINGYAGSGKDTIGTIIQFLKCYNTGDLTINDVVTDYPLHKWWLEEQSGWEIKKWAGKLKTIANILTGIPEEKFEDQEFKKTLLGPEWSIHGMPLTVRGFLQKLGTDGLRVGLHYNTWVNALMADYKTKEEDENGDITSPLANGQEIKWKPMPGWEDKLYPNWIITDTRFPNEANAIKRAGGYIIRVNRPGYGPVNNHPSETSLDEYKFDYVIENSGGLKELLDKVLVFLENQNLM